ncbi:hypothetical protein AAEX37_00798 [Oligella sp. MSHR50489EDL]
MAYEDDIKIRLEDEKNPPEGIAVEAYEFEMPTPDNPVVVYEKDGVKVTSFVKGTSKSVPAPVVPHRWDLVVYGCHSSDA